MKMQKMLISAAAVLTAVWTKFSLAVSAAGDALQPTAYQEYAPQTALETILQAALLILIPVVAGGLIALVIVLIVRSVIRKKKAENGKKD